MTFSDFLELEILDHILNDGAYTAPTNPHVALCNTTPNDAAFGTEPGNGYARQSTGAADWNAAASGAKDNANAITFPTATGTWGTITHFGIFSLVTAGDFMMWGALDASKAVGNGDTPSFAAGALNITLD